MKIMFRGRRGGKTIESIKVAAETGSYILCFNEAEKHRLLEVAKSMRVHIRNPVTIAEMMHDGQFHTNFVKGLVIDNAEMILKHLFWRSQIHLITMTDENADVAPTI